MSDELQRPPDEEEKDMETVSEDAPEKETVPPDEDDESISAEELRAELGEIGTRVRTAGLKPARQMLRSYVDNMLDAVDGLLSALEGNKRKKGD